MLLWGGGIGACSVAYEAWWWCRVRAHPSPTENPLVMTRVSTLTTPPASHRVRSNGSMIATDQPL
jgi:hypothetical protein